MELVLRNGGYAAYREGDEAVVYEAGKEPDSDSPNAVFRLDLNDAGAVGLGNFIAQVLLEVRGEGGGVPDGGTGVDTAVVDG